MSAAKAGPTPGPWKVVKNTGIIAAKECHIGRIGDFTDKELLRFNRARWEADARLIAAAPDMLAALTALAEIANDEMQSRPPTMRVKIDAIKSARAAIAAATGETE